MIKTVHTDTGESIVKSVGYMLDVYSMTEVVGSCSRLAVGCSTQKVVHNTLQVGKHILAQHSDTV